MFDWIRFFKSRGVSYVTRGPNVGHGGVGIKCPFCGPSDPSEHMSISLRGAGWRCWRNPRAHAGKSRSRLIQAILNCSLEEAQRLAGEAGSPAPEDEDLAAKLGELLGVRSATSARPSSLAFPPEFKPFRSYGGSATPFWGYLENRGYTEPEIRWLLKNYELQYATRGAYRYRIILPVFSAESRLNAWTARSILQHEELRYKTTPVNPPWKGYTGPIAVKPPGQLLLGLPLLLRCPNPEILVVCEGPFDAIRVSTLGHQLGVYGTCLFGLNITDSQVLLLERLMSRFQRLILLLDPDAELLNLRIREQLTFPVQFGRLPHGVEDPGALTPEVADVLMRGWLEIANTRERSYGKRQTAGTRSLP